VANQLSTSIDVLPLKPATKVHPASAVAKGDLHALGCGGVIRQQKAGRSHRRLGLSEYASVERRRNASQE
jgi:hypothetical protein